MRACESCHGPGPCLWSNDHQDYRCVKCHETPNDVFFHMDEIQQVMHPNGHCTCHGEGNCEWCKRTIAEELKDDDPKIRPDWKTPCSVCGAVPTMPLTGMCGPCTFGEADTKDGNW